MCVNMGVNVGFSMRAKRGVNGCQRRCQRVTVVLPQLSLALHTHTHTHTQTSRIWGYGDGMVCSRSRTWAAPPPRMPPRAAGSHPCDGPVGNPRQLVQIPGTVGCRGPITSKLATTWEAETNVTGTVPAEVMDTNATCRQQHANCPKPGCFRRGAKKSCVPKSASKFRSL